MYKQDDARRELQKSFVYGMVQISQNAIDEWWCKKHLLQIKRTNKSGINNGNPNAINQIIPPI